MSIKRFKCWLFGHRINTYLIEHTNQKECTRCGEILTVWSIYTVDDYLEQTKGVKMEKEFNMTCLVTGKKDNLRMHAMRNDNGDMIGWVFLHEDTQIEDLNANVEWEFKSQCPE